MTVSTLRSLGGGRAASLALSFAAIAFVIWMLFRDFEHRRNSPFPLNFDLGFLIVIIFVFWLQSRRTFGVWITLTVGIGLAAACFWLNKLAAVNTMRAISADDAGLKAILAYAGFFGLALVWIVATPADESMRRAGLIPKAWVRYVPFAVAAIGVALMASAAALFRHQVFDLGPRPLGDYPSLVRRDAFYLAAAFLTLAICRALLPVIASNPKFRPGEQ
jgi:hypothetical protein